uniref:Uncharacterized protein n=1 Tax=Aegilops tauschii subsp. strangulata TaxID=200361 RepID=A0A453SY38_AEGTS
MAGEVSKKEVGTVLMQAMMAAKNLRSQPDRLLHLQRCLQRLQAGPAAPDEDKLGGLASDLFKVYYIGMEAGARMLSTCLELAVQNGGRYSMNPAFARMPDEQLHDALLAHRLPARGPGPRRGRALRRQAARGVPHPALHRAPRRLPPPAPRRKARRHLLAGRQAQDSHRPGQGARLPGPRVHHPEPRRQARRPRRRRALPLPRPEGARQPRRVHRQDRLHLRGRAISINR